MKRLFIAALTVCLSASVLAQRGGAPNTLTGKEKKEGWILLFDGKTLDQFNVTPNLVKVFNVVDGAIKTDAKAGGGTMYTKEQFSNFILKPEFRAHPDINSGIILRQPLPVARGEKPVGGNGYELQIRDRNPGNYSAGDFLTGSVVGVSKAPHDV